MQTILLFGATGSVGAYTAIGLKEQGYNVIAVAHRKSDNGMFEEYGIPYYSVDVSDQHTFDVLPQSGIDQVIHFAGAMPARMKDYNPHLYVETIVEGTLNVLEYMRKIGTKKIIFAQSISDILYKFGTSTPINPDCERRNPLTGDHAVYSISKNAAVNLIEHYHAQYGFSRFILRLPTIYVYQPNPYYYVDGKLHWMGYRFLIDKAIKGEPIELWGDPTSEKEIVYVRDFVQIVEKCVESHEEGGIYNVGTGVGVSMEEQIHGIIEVFSPKEHPSIVIKAPDKPSSPHFRLDIKKTLTLGYVPRYDYISYLKDLKKEMRINRFAKIWGKPEDFTPPYIGTEPASSYCKLNNIKLAA